MKITRFFVLLFVATVMATLLFTACGGPKVGDHLTTRYEEVFLIADWNATSYVKPVACLLFFTGTEVEVVDVSTLIRGSSDHETIIQVQTLDGKCTGWGFPDQFRKVKEDK